MRAPIDQLLFAGHETTVGRIAYGTPARIRVGGGSIRWRRGMLFRGLEELPVSW